MLERKHITIYKRYLEIMYPHDLDFGFQTFGAGSGEEIACRIRILSPFVVCCSSSSVEQKQ